MPQQQTQQSFPQANLPVVEPKNGVLLHEWLVFFRSLWVKTGSGTSSTGSLVYIQQDSSGPPAIYGAYSCLTGTRLGTVTLT